MMIVGDPFTAFSLSGQLLPPEWQLEILCQ
jgi:hypothetical protein